MNPQERLAGWEGEVVVTQADIDMTSTICNPIDNPYMFRILSKKFAKHRLAAIEEAAKVADEQYADSGWHPAARNAGIGIAEAIRSLSAPPPPPVAVEEGSNGS